MTEREFRAVRRRMQMVFQEPYVSLNPRWQVRDLIAEPLALAPKLSRIDREARILQLLDLVNLSRKRAFAYPHELTAGEQKRVGIARALAASPDFVVFDECTTALDIRVRAQIIDLVRNLQAEMGLSALFITHDLNSVRSLAHYVAVMRNGKIIEMGEAHGQWQPMPTAIYMFVPDADAVYRRALEAGAASLWEPTDQPYGDRSGAVTDPFGNTWYIATHIKDVTM